MKNIYFLLINYALIIISIKSADQPEQKLQLHPEAYKAIQQLCLEKLITRNFGSFARAAQQETALAHTSAVIALPASASLAKPLAKVFLAVSATDEKSKYWSNHADLEIALDIDTKAKRNIQGIDPLPILYVTSKGNTAQWIKVNPNPDTVPFSFFEHRNQIYVSFQPDSQDIYPISVSKLSDKSQGKIIESPCVISRSSITSSLPTMTQPQRKAKPQLSGKMKQDKVIRSNLNILLQQKGAPGRFFDNERSDSSNTWQAARNTIEKYGKNLNDGEVENMLDRALYEKLEKPK